MNKVKVIFVCLIFLFISTILYALDTVKDNTFFGLKKYTQELKKNVFALQAEGDLTNKDENDDYIVLGSGFLIQKNNFVIGITCKHLVLKNVKIEEGKIKMQDGKIVLKRPIYIGLDTEDGYRRFKAEVFHIDGQYDFAMLLPIKDNPEDQIKLKNLVLNDSYLGSNDLIVEGKGILIIGYPLGLGVEYNKNSPIVNFGIISQYKKQENFLIDITVNSGNSGSPVFSLEDGKFVGMITSFTNAQTLLYDQNGKLVATLPYNSGLANALPVGVIKTKLDELIKATSNKSE